MNTPRSGVEDSVVETLRNPVIARISKAILIAAMALGGMGCLTGAKVREATTECLDKKEKAGEQVRALCTDNTEAIKECLKNKGKEGGQDCKDNKTKLNEIIFRECEVPKAETEIHFLQKYTTVGAKDGPVNAGIRDFCAANEKDRKD